MQLIAASEPMQMPSRSGGGWTSCTVQSPTTLVSAGSSYLLINGLVLPFLAFAMIGNGALRGAGDTTPGLYGAILSRWVIVVPLAWFLALRLDMGVSGVWWALAVGTIFQAVFVLWNWLLPRWIRISLQRSRIYRLHLLRLAPAQQQAFLDQFRQPLLASGDCAEIVDGKGVTYRMPEGEARIEFDRDSQKVRDLDVDQNIWLADTTKRMLEDPGYVAAAPLAPASCHPISVTNSTFGPGTAWPMANRSANCSLVSAPLTSTTWRWSSGTIVLTPPTAISDSSATCSANAPIPAFI